MKTSNIGIIVLKTLFYNTVRDLIRFPIWWYTRGLYNTWLSFIEGSKNANRTTGTTIWMKNIFTPMYGQNDITGRIISVLIRLAQISIRLIVLIVWILVLFLKVIVWIAFPIIITTQIIYQLTGGITFL